MLRFVIVMFLFTSMNGCAVGWLETPNKEEMSNISSNGRAAYCKLRLGGVREYLGEQEERVGVSRQAIYNGALDMTENVGVVLITTTVGYCSGIMLNSCTVLTAKHCFDMIEGVKDAYVETYLGKPTMDNKPLIEAMDNGQHVYRRIFAGTFHTEIDLAILGLDLPMELTYNEIKYAQPKLNDIVMAWGYGQNNFVTEYVAGRQYGTSVVRKLWKTGQFLLNGGAGCPGDSGGPVFDSSGRLIGVNSRKYPAGETCNGMSVSQGLDIEWINQWMWTEALDNEV